MDYQQFNSALEAGGELVRQSFSDWRTPVFFLQFSLCPPRPFLFGQNGADAALLCVFRILT